MKKIHRIRLGFILALVAVMTLQSCFDLEEETFNILESRVYYRDKASVESIIANLYISIDRREESFTELQELPADQTDWRTWNGGAWGWDEGARYFISTQDWNPETTRIQHAWAHGFNALGYCNSALDDFAELNPHDLRISQEELDGYIAEVRTLRAWIYFRLYELYGGVLPITTTIDPTVLPASASSDFDEGMKLIYDFIIRELDESLDGLSQNVPNRMNQAANRLIKARLLLNAELFIGEDRYAECEALSQDIIDGKYGNYSLASDWRDNWIIENTHSQEVIFAVSWQYGYYTNQNYRVAPFVPRNVVRHYFEVDGIRPLNFSNFWNCWILTPSYDNSGSLLAGEEPKSFVFDYGDKLGAVMHRLHDNDIRKQNFVYDMETGEYHGMMLDGPMNEVFGTGVPIVGDADYHNEHLVFVDQVGTFKNLGRNLEDVMSPRWGETNSGVRLMKYPIYPGATGLHMQNAANVYMRLAEAYYMLAECRLRRGDAQGALALVNQVRQRHFSSEDWLTAQNEFPGFNAIDLDWMLSEWGLEFLWEGQRRRTDLRRFDKFTQGQWWFFGRAVGEDGSIIPAVRDRKYEWYPIPTVALSANRNLVQNPAYQ